MSSLENQEVLFTDELSIRLFDGSFVRNYPIRKGLVLKCYTGYNSTIVYFLS